MSEQKPFLVLFLQTASCCNACRHCGFVSRPHGLISSSRLIEVVTAFMEEANAENSQYDHLAPIITDSPLNYPQLPEIVEYLNAKGLDGGRSIAVNGFAFRKNSRWMPYLEALQDAGLEQLEFTLYGQRDTHDWFARRSDDYERILELADLWVKCGGKTSWGMFVHKKNIHELEIVRNTIEARFGAKVDPMFWHHIGRAMSLEELQLDIDDFDYLSEDIQESFSGLKSEAQWARQLCNANDRPFPANPRMVHLVVKSNGEIDIPLVATRQGHKGLTIGKFSERGVRELLSSWKKEHTRWVEQFPSLGKLALDYGDVSNRRVYDEGSIKKKWANQFICDRRFIIDPVRRSRIDHWVTE